MKAYSYIRWSSAKQTSGDSLRRQTELAEAYAKKHGLALDVATYQDHGISAFHGKNALEGKLGAFLRAVEQGQVETPCYLLVEHLDRISRADINDAAALFLSIIRAGVTVVTLQNEQIFSKESTSKNWTELILVLANLANAHEESRKKSERLKKVFAQKRAERETGKFISKSCPAWLKVIEEDDKREYRVITWKAKIIKRIFELAISGYGVTKIANKLNEEKTKTFGRKTTNGWTEHHVMRILKQPAVTGLYKETFGDTEIENYYPAVISKQDWIICQSALKGRHNGGGFKKGSRNNLFATLARCAYCGSTFKYMTTQSSDKRDGDKRDGESWLYCRNRSLKRCTAHMIRYLPVEIELLTFFAVGTKMDMIAHEMDSTSTSRKRELQNELLELTDRIKRLTDAIEFGTGNLPSIVSRLKEAQTRHDAMQTELSSLKDAPNVHDEFHQILDLLYELTPGAKAQDHTVRLKFQTTLRRQVKRIEIASKIQERPKVRESFKNCLDLATGEAADLSTVEHAARIIFKGPTPDQDGPTFKIKISPKAEPFWLG